MKEKCQLRWIIGNSTSSCFVQVNTVEPNHPHRRLRRNRISYPMKFEAPTQNLYLGHAFLPQSSE